MPVLEIITSSGLGSLLGMRHALEPDHLTAVSTLVTGERSSYRAAMLGAFWGLGHTLSLVVVGAVLVVLRAEMPARVVGPLRAVRRGHAGRTRPACGASGRAAGPRRPGARASSRPPRAQSRRRDAARARRQLDARAASAPGRRRARPGRQRRPHGARARHAVLDDGADHLHGAFRTRIDARHGGVVRAARLAARAAGRKPRLVRAMSLAVGCVSIALGLFWGYPLTSRLLIN